MSNYYIGFDMDGTPYIEHVSKHFGTRNNNAKYVAKVETSSGTRYFYSNDEYRAYLMKKPQLNKQKARKASSGMLHKYRRARRKDGFATVPYDRTNRLFSKDWYRDTPE